MTVSWDLPQNFIGGFLWTFVTFFPVVFIISYPDVGWKVLIIPLDP